MADSQSSESELVPDSIEGDSVKDQPGDAMGSNEAREAPDPLPCPVPPDGSDSMKSLQSGKTVGDSSKQLSLKSKTQVDSSPKEFPLRLS